MLSYRHAFHAGNFADLLKHIVQFEILQYLLKKDKPFEYIDTHAGAGIYQLNSPMADKTQEYLTGIGRFVGNEQHDLPEIQPFLAHINQCIEAYSAIEKDLYPGSPTIAEQLLRPQDRAWLFELHSADFPLLEQQFSRNRRIFTRQEDGYKGLLGLLPCASRRALVLVDPPYEIKDDYEKVVSVIQQAYRKMPNATFAIWYPVVQRDRIDSIKEQFVQSGVRSVVQFELGIKADTESFGMTSAGMIVINPPWTLFSYMQDLLPKLAAIMSVDNKLHYRCEEWVGE